MSLRKPEFITFTGADDWTDIRGMMALSGQYPIEWGILFSPTRQGVDPRYPGGDAQSRFWWSGLRLAAHLCGEHSRRVMEGKMPDIPVDLWFCDRVQINHADPRPDLAAQFVEVFGAHRAIVQCRAAFPISDSHVDWLFDQSGGRGALPQGWPSHHGDRLRGFAGGINPENVAKIVGRLEVSGPYWIDMESGVRTDDHFDLKKVRQVCELVFDGRGAE